MVIRHSWNSFGLEVLLKSQGMLPWSHIAALPESGIMVYSADTPIAAGFLRKVEDNSAILDSLITNKDIDAVVRDKALDMLVTELLKVAKGLGITNIIAFSSDPHTLMRAKRFGFAELPHQVISLKLT